MRASQKVKPSSHTRGKNSGFRNWRVTTDGFARKDGDGMDARCDVLYYAIVTRYGPTMPPSERAASFQNSGGTSTRSVAVGR